MANRQLVLPERVRAWLQAGRPSEVAQAWRRLALYGIPATVTLAWLAAMLATGSLDRALDHWQSTVTMIFGGFLGGSSPAGGGAVAFPVFTKVLEVPAPVARTFSLSIQAVGMTTAAAIMLLARHPLEPRVIVTGLIAGGAGFLTGLLLLADADTPFWEPTIPASYVKVTFTLILASVSYIMFVSLRAQGHDHGALRIPHWNWRVWTGLIVATFLGGVISMLIGTGVNVLLFLFAVTMAGLHPRVGVASSIVTMAGLSLLGFVVLGIAHGQLNIELAASGDVVAVGGAAVSPLPADRYDLLGLWIAAIPVVVWSAPLGTYVVHILTEHRLIAFVGVLAATEVISTFILLDDLHSDPALIAYGAGGLVTVLVGVRLLRRYRREILDLPAAEPATELGDGAAGRGG